jgi:hypothetical protein
MRTSGGANEPVVILDGMPIRISLVFEPCCWSKVQGPNAPKLGEAFADLFFQRPGVSPNLVSDI